MTANFDAPGCEVDDAAAPPGEHVGQHGLTAEEDAVDVDAERRAPVRLRELGHRAEPARAGVVHEEVDAAERRERLRDHAPGPLPVADVRHDRRPAAAQPPDLGRDGGGAAGLHVVDRDAPPVTGEPERDRAADAGPRARDQRRPGSRYGSRRAHPLPRIR
jgi:hypothetical protein